MSEIKDIEIAIPAQLVLRVDSRAIQEAMGKILADARGNTPFTATPADTPTQDRTPAATAPTTKPAPAAEESIFGAEEDPNTARVAPPSTAAELDATNFWTVPLPFPFQDTQKQNIPKGTRLGRMKRADLEKLCANIQQVKTHAQNPKMADKANEMGMLIAAIEKFLAPWLADKANDYPSGDMPPGPAQIADAAEKF